MAVAQRIKKIIDDDSWLNMLIPSAESVILFVHGTFGDASDTWGSTPDALLSMPALSSFDTGSFGYSSKVFDRRLPEIFAKKLRSWIEVNLNNYVDIYIVAHSMGGLLTRHALYTMLKDPKQYPVIKNIRRCFLVASPVTGSKVAEFLNRVPFISKLHSRLDYLQDPRIDDMPMGEAYENAARVYLNSGGNEIDIPRFHMYTAQDDKIVSLPGKSFYTRYDKDESVVPGTHGTSKENKDVNSMLVMSISQIISSSSGASMSSQILRSTAVQAFAREREHTTSALVSALRSPRSQKQPADVIIISCSNTKSDLHGDFFNTNNSLASEVDDSDLRKLLFATRTRILVSVQSGYVDGIEYKEGNRSKKKIKP
jgi:pimeloyl-ACP methyl ester carboxylesterase